MALILEKLLLISFEDLIANGPGIEISLESLDTEAKKEAVLQKIHDLTVRPGDKVYCMDSRFPVYVCRQLHIALGLHIAAKNTDTAAGTGSVASQTVDSFSQSNTMAKNNSPFDDARNMNQYGTDFYNIISDNDPKTTFMI